MNDIIPFQFDGHSIRVVTDEHGEPLFVGKDLCEALGYANPSDAISRHCKGVAKRYPLLTAGGTQETRVLNEGDMFRLVVNSTLPSAERFERLVFDEILPTIRKTGSYPVPGQKAPVSIAFDALKLAPAAVRAARAFGLDKNAAAISASQFVRKVTGIHLLEEFGATHLKAEDQSTAWLTPTDLGKQIGVSSRQFNLLLAEAGLQAKQGDDWEPTSAAEGFFRRFDTGKRHGSGVPVQQVKWSPHVIALVKPVKDAA